MEDTRTVFNGRPREFFPEVVGYSYKGYGGGRILLHYNQMIIICDQILSKDGTVDCWYNSELIATLCIKSTERIVKCREHEGYIDYQLERDL